MAEYNILKSWYNFVLILFICLVLNRMEHLYHIEEMRIIAVTIEKETYITQK